MKFVVTKKPSQFLQNNEVTLFWNINDLSEMEIQSYLTDKYVEITVKITVKIHISDRCFSSSQQRLILENV